MPIILSIESSADVCSVALSQDGELLIQQMDDGGRNHASLIAPYVDKCIEELTRREMKLDAVAVSSGPGSYTGLRIGMSMAKGLCFGFNIPLITISTLELLAVKAMFSSMEWTGEEILVPMIDARRMEVYTAAYDFALNPLLEPQPLIVDDTAYSSLDPGRVQIFFGDGMDKCREVLDRPGRMFIEGIKPTASGMMALAERAFRQGNFADTAYAVPTYLKDYDAKKPKKMF